MKLTAFKQCLQILLAAAICATGSASSAAEAVTVVRHMFTAQENAAGLGYEEEMLTLLLQKTAAQYGPFRLERVSSITQGRAFRELVDGRLDVVSSMTDTERERLAVPIRYCLYRGLLGVRIGMGRQSTVSRLDALNKFQALRSTTLGSVFDWPDFQIQKEAGLRAVKVSSFQAGIDQVRDGRIDLIPLGVVEVQPIARGSGLAIINGWAIAYPSAYYFFTSPQNPVLTKRLNHAFELTLKDGSFARLFDARMADRIRTLQLEHRHIFRLPNRNLPTATQVGRPELWHPMATQLLGPPTGWTQKFGN